MKNLICVLSIALLSPFAHAEEKMKMNFTNEELVKIIQAYSKASGQKFVVDPGVRGKVSILIPEPVTLPEAFNQLSSALALNGYAISKQEDTMIITSARNIQRNLIEVSSERPALKPERMYSWVYNAKHASVSQINRDLRILPSRDGEMNIYEPGNQMIITDWASNLNRIAEVLKQIDAPVSPETSKLVAESKKLRRETFSKPVVEKPKPPVPPQVQE